MRRSAAREHRSWTTNADEEVRKLKIQVTGGAVWLAIERKEITQSPKMLDRRTFTRLGKHSNCVQYAGGTGCATPTSWKLEECSKNRPRRSMRSIDSLCHRTIDSMVQWIKIVNRPARDASRSLSTPLVACFSILLGLHRHRSATVISTDCDTVLAGRRWLRGEMNSKAGALSDFAGHFDGPVVLRNDLVHDRESQTRAFSFCAGMLGRVERIENVREIRRGDAMPCVADVDGDPLGLEFGEGVGADGELSTLRQSVQCIDEQIQEHLPELLPVDQH